MTKEELEAQLNEMAKLMQEQVAEFNKQLNELKKEYEQAETPKSEIWKPQEGEEFWYVDYAGDVEETSFYGGYGDTHCVDIGNAYPTEEKAQFEADREKYTRLFRQYVEQHSEPLDWSDSNQEKWYVYYDNVGKTLYYMYNTIAQNIEVYGSSEEVMRDAVDFVERDNFLRYIIGVKEEDENAD